MIMNNEKKALGAILLGAGTLVSMLVAGKLIKKKIEHKTEENEFEESEWGLFLFARDRNILFNEEGSNNIL